MGDRGLAEVEGGLNLADAEGVVPGEQVEHSQPGRVGQRSKGALLLGQPRVVEPGAGDLFGAARGATGAGDLECCGGGHISTIFDIIP